MSTSTGRSTPGMPASINSTPYRLDPTDRDVLEGRHGIAPLGRQNRHLPLYIEMTLQDRSYVHDPHHRDSHGAFERAQAATPAPARAHSHRLRSATGACGRIPAGLTPRARSPTR